MTALNAATPEQLLLTSILNVGNRKVSRKIQSELKRRRNGKDGK